jgi:hypothetical protein
MSLSLQTESKMFHILEQSVVHKLTHIWSLSLQLLISTQQERALDAMIVYDEWLEMKLMICLGRNQEI